MSEHKEMKVNRSYPCVRKEKAKAIADRIYAKMYPRPTTHQEWAEAFNIRGDIRLVLMGKEPLG